MGLFSDMMDETGALRDEIARLKAERLKLDKRIHNQRVALRETWEIVEKRGNWLGSPASRRRYHWLWKQYQELKSQTPDDGQSLRD
jgi:hypothetical protein